MALLDRERDLIVVRIVYDGPPWSGKTTSLRALGEGLERTTTTPEEREGRTRYFDWLDYVGGMYDGHRIRCQVVTVPGQPELRERREHLLRDADSVVFVADTTRGKFQASLAGFADCRQLLAGRDPPVALVMQANKRDLSDAVPLAELQRHLAEFPAVGVVETVASDGRGIRSAFILGVRLALDRVRELQRQGRLPEGKPEVDSSEELLERMHALDLDRVEPVASTRHAGIDTEEVTSEPVPAVPNADVPSGRIWPPVEGRLILHDVSLAGESRLERWPSGIWYGRSADGRWELYSSASDRFAELETGERRLLEWARLHAQCSSLLSVKRAVCLVEDSGGGGRLWQIKRVTTTVADAVEGALQQKRPELIGTTLFEAVRLLIDASRRFVNAPCHLPCTAHTVARSGWRAVYADRMPSLADLPQALPEREPEGVVAWREAARLVPPALLSPGDISLACSAAQRMGARHPQLDMVAPLVAQVLLRGDSAAL